MKDVAVASRDEFGGSEDTCTRRGRSPHALHGDRERDSHRVFARELIAQAPLLRRIARSLTRDEAQAEDLTQDALLRAWAARDRFEMGTNMKAWLSTILRRLHISALRQRRFVGDYSEDIERSLGVDATQHLAIEVEDVRKAMDDLPLHQRDAIELIAVQQLSYEAAAARLNIPAGTVKSRVTRGRRALKTLLTRARHAVVSENKLVAGTTRQSERLGIPIAVDASSSRIEAAPYRFK